MKNLAVLIFDLDKMTKDQWKQLWSGCGDYVIKVNEEDRQRIIDAVEKIQDERLGIQHAGEQEEEI